MQLSVERTDGIGAFARPLGGEVRLDELSETLATEVRELFTPERLATFRARPSRSAPHPDAQTIVIRMIDDDGVGHTFELTEDDDVDLFDLGNELVNRIVTTQLRARAGYDAVLFAEACLRGDDADRFETLAAVRALARAGHRVGLVALDLDEATSSIDLSVFDAELVVTEAARAASTTDASFFDRTVRQRRLAPARCVYVSPDDAELEAAAEAGLRAVRSDTESLHDVLVEILEHDEAE